jgi:hypothetical protein
MLDAAYVNHLEPGSNSPFEILRLRAEADTAARLDPDKPQTRRPSWAPPLVLTGELLDLCIKLGLLTSDDKPIARLWAQFASPKKVARVLREANVDQSLAMPEIACRGFELYAGGERGKKSRILFRTQRYGNGKWETGPNWYKPSLWRSFKTQRTQRQVDLLQKRVDSFTGDPSCENPLRDFTAALHREQQLLAEGQAADQREYQACLEHYELGRRATELAAARVVEFAGDYDVQVRLAGRLCGHCCECFRLLTDPKSLEIGIGPECVQKVCWVSPQGSLVRMIDAIADGRIAAVNGTLRWVAAP